MAINTAEVLKQLKKQNGEQASHDIRDARLESIPNIAHILEFAGKNPAEIRSLFPILREMYVKPIESEYVSDKDPIELLDMAGYRAWYVTNEEEQNAIAGYFRDARSVEHGMTGGNPRTDRHELICTVGQNWDDGRKRFDDHYIIHAVKKEAFGDDKLPESEWHIKPSEIPERQDDYGTSVISIQVSKRGDDISIKNRYNHTVPECDKTFNNNPDNIIPGLTNSIKNHFHVDFSVTNAEIPQNFRLVHGQFIRYNYEVENVCFDANYYFRGSDMVRIDKNSEMMLDYFVLDKKKKCLLNPSGVKDPAFDILAELINGKNIKDVASPDNPKEKVIYADGIRVAATENGKIIELNLPNVTEIGDGFLQLNDSIKRLNIPNVRKIGKFFLANNACMTKFDAPNLEEVGSYILNGNTILQEFNAPKLKSVGNDFLAQNNAITDLWLPELETVGNAFFFYNKVLKSVYVPKLRVVGDNFLSTNMELTKLGMSQLQTCGQGFVNSNKKLQSVILPELLDAGDNFMRFNIQCNELYVPKMKQCGNNFMCNNKGLTSVRFDELETVGGFFLERNQDIESLYAPKLKHVGISFMADNKKLKHLDLPSLEDTDFSPILLTNYVLESVNVPHLRDTERAKQFLTYKVANAKTRKTVEIAEAAKTVKDDMELFGSGSETESEDNPFVFQLLNEHVFQ